MKLLVGLGALILLFSLPAHAQLGTVGGSSSSYSGGSINTSNASSVAPVVFPQITPLPATRFGMSITSGSSFEFVPSTFMAFDKAVVQGVADLAAKPKSVAEVAQENRNKERAKAQISFVQDGKGKLMKAPE
jgi:hypothetical protein